MRPLNRLAVVARVPRIFAPQGAQAGFHRVAGHNAGESHTIAIAKPNPMRAVFARLVEQCSETRQLMTPPARLAGPKELTANHFNRSSRLME